MSEETRADTPANDTTRYLAFEVTTNPTTIEPILGPDRGAFVVRVGRGDLAKQQALTILSERQADATEFTIAVVTERNWQVETFEKEPPKPPAFKPKA